MQWTNVLELYSRLEVNEYQQRYYRNGVGATYRTLSSLWKFLGDVLDLAIAWFFQPVLAFRICEC